MTPGKAQVLVVTADSELAGRYSNALNNAYDVIATVSLDDAQAHIDSRAPSLLVLDPAIVAGELTGCLASLLECHANMRIVVVEDDVERKFDQYTLFRVGVHGFCRDNISEALLAKAVQVILEGEYWIPRKLITRVISEIAHDAEDVVTRPDGPDDSLISTLTPRELQVARMVHMGGNNKMIARELDISERTVKAHLSAIFRKLDIENRLHLALYFSGRT